MIKILKADERKYAILITIDGEIRFVQKDDSKKMFDIARQKINCEWIEPVHCGRLHSDMVMLIDEEGKMKDNYINPIASWLYGTPKHGDPIVGNALVVIDGYEDYEYMNGNEAAHIAKQLEETRANAYSWARKVIGVEKNY